VALAMIKNMPINIAPRRSVFTALPALLTADFLVVFIYASPFVRIKWISKIDTWLCCLSRFVGIQYENERGEL
jgi:hypothetical protein